MYSWDSRGGAAWAGTCGAACHGRRGGRGRHREWSAPARPTSWFAAGRNFLSRGYRASAGNCC